MRNWILQDVFGIVAEVEDVIQEFESENERIKLSRFLMDQSQIDFSQNIFQSLLYSSESQVTTDPQDSNDSQDSIHPQDGIISQISNELQDSI